MPYNKTTHRKFPVRSLAIALMLLVRTGTGLFQIVHRHGNFRQWIFRAYRSAKSSRLQKAVDLHHIPLIPDCSTTLKLAGWRTSSIHARLAGTLGGVTLNALMNGNTKSSLTGIWAKDTLGWLISQLPLVERGIPTVGYVISRVVFHSITACGYTARTSIMQIQVPYGFALRGYGCIPRT